LEAKKERALREPVESREAEQARLTDELRETWNERVVEAVQTWIAAPSKITASGVCETLQAAAVDVRAKLATKVKCKVPVRRYYPEGGVGTNGQSWFLNEESGFRWEATEYLSPRDLSTRPGGGWMQRE